MAGCRMMHFLSLSWAALFLCSFPDFVSASKSDSLSAPASSSVLAALLESHYTDMVELIEAAGLLHLLEGTVSNGNVTIFAFENEYFERQFDSEFKAYLLQPANLKALQRVLKCHVIDQRIGSAEWKNGTIVSLSNDPLHISQQENEFKVERFSLVSPDSIIRDDGIVHGIYGLLIPEAVEKAYSAKRLENVEPALFPTGAPVLDLSAILLAKPVIQKDAPDHIVKHKHESSEFDIGCAPAPSPDGDLYGANGDERVSDFVSALVKYGGYNEIADLLVNLTSFASEIARLVNEGHRVTVLAPDDKAIGNLSLEHLNEPGGIEALLTYHIIPEYQTEESLYHLVRTHGQVTFETLRSSFKLKAKEADGTVEFGEGKHAALLYDHDIYADGRIAVQGINNVLMPQVSSSDSPSPSPSHSAPAPSPQAHSHRRGISEAFHAFFFGQNRKLRHTTPVPYF